MKLSGIIALASIVMLAPLGAGASALLYDQNLATPNGVFYGSGNFNGGWTVNSDASGVELGLRAKYRFGFTDATIIHSSTNTYEVPVGVNANKALWNYDWSINLIGALGPSLPDITASLTITDVNSGISATIDPLSYWKDNAGWGYPEVFVGGFPVKVNLAGQHTAPAIDVKTGLPVPAMLVWGAQNSENPNFANFPLSAGFNALEAGKEYRFDLSVLDSSGTPMASDTIFVDTVVPEPASLFMIGSGLLLVGLYRRRKSHSARLS